MDRDRDLFNYDYRHYGFSLPRTHCSAAKIKAILVLRIPSKWLLKKNLNSPSIKPSLCRLNLRTGKNFLHVDRRLT